MYFLKVLPVYQVFGSSKRKYIYQIRKNIFFLIKIRRVLRAFIFNRHKIFAFIVKIIPNVLWNVARIFKDALLLVDLLNYLFVPFVPFTVALTIYSHNCAYVDYPNATFAQSFLPDTKHSLIQRDTRNIIRMWQKINYASYSRNNFHRDQRYL